VPDLPWTARAEMEAGSDYPVMASHLPLKRVSSTVRFFRGVSVPEYSGSRGMDIAQQHSAGCHR
jgi:hypothetical protein